MLESIVPNLRDDIFTSIPWPQRTDIRSSSELMGWSSDHDLLPSTSPDNAQVGIVTENLGDIPNFGNFSETLGNFGKLWETLGNFGNDSGDISASEEIVTELRSIILVTEQGTSRAYVH